jgi:phosphonate transport system substrate-binding protein
MKRRMHCSTSGISVRSMTLAVVTFLTLFFNTGQLFAGQNTYQIAVVPSVPPEITYANWKPFIELLSRETKLQFNLKVYDKMTDFEADVASGSPDLIFASPTQMIMARKKQGYIPLVRSSKQVAGVLFVRKDSPVRSVNDLNGKEIAFVGAKNL